jgi:hypothetical protein
VDDGDDDVDALEGEPAHRWLEGFIAECDAFADARQAAAQESAQRLGRSAVVTLGATIRKCREAGRPDAAEELERLRLEVVRVIARLGRA